MASSDYPNEGVENRHFSSQNSRKLIEISSFENITQCQVLSLDMPAIILPSITKKDKIFLNITFILATKHFHLVCV